MKQKVTAVFDIGKTNKKFFLFNSNYQEVFKEYAQFDEIEDEDGFSTDDLHALQSWIISLFDKVLRSNKFNIKALNFSTYGASFVHLDEEGKVLTPLYNYLKPIPSKIKKEFHDTYGNISAETGSPESGMLNSGMQLYWIKKTKPEVYKKIKYSLHLPQYISYLFTGIPLSEYTSLGCHTGLWDFDKKDYHNWVYQEKINKILPPIVSTRTSHDIIYEDKKIKIGVGIHDSSSALLPYVFSVNNKFLLVSTGTWSIVLNPFNSQKLSTKDISDNCLNYMQIDGKRVKATRFFMGNEYKLQVHKLSNFFQKEYGYHLTIKFDPTFYLEIKECSDYKFLFEGIRIRKNTIKKTDLSQFFSFEEAYHQLMFELIDVQLATIKNAIGDTQIEKIFIDGGFTDNDIFVKLIGYYLKNHQVATTQTPLGSALGAAMVISNKELSKTFLGQHYQMKKLSPLHFFDDNNQ